MRRVVLMGWVGLGGVCIAGCIGPERANVEGSSARVSEVAATYVQQQGADAALAPHGKAKLELVLTPSTAGKAEDGRGSTVTATDPLALDIRGSLPVRALDPVLHVGALHFHAYRYPKKGVLRFVVADRASLPAGAPAFLQWGSDAASRIPLVRALKVPK